MIHYSVSSSQAGGTDVNKFLETLVSLSGEVVERDHRAGTENVNGSTAWPLFHPLHSPQARLFVPDLL